MLHTFLYHLASMHFGRSCPWIPLRQITPPKHPNSLVNRSTSLFGKWSYCHSSSSGYLDRFSRTRVASFTFLFLHNLPLPLSLSLKELISLIVCNGTRLSKLPELFPGQAELASSICRRSGQPEVAALFGQPVMEDKAEFSTNTPLSGSPLLALYRARHLYANKPESEASDIFIRTATVFRKC